MASNFAALWPTDPTFSALKDLNPLKIVQKVQKANGILRVGFACLNWPYLHRAYVVSSGFGCLYLYLLRKVWTVAIKGCIENWNIFLMRGSRRVLVKVMFFHWRGHNYPYDVATKILISNSIGSLKGLSNEVSFIFLFLAPFWQIKTFCRKFAIPAHQ